MSTRRRFTLQERLDIINEYDATPKGSKWTVLHREGLGRNTIRTWKRREDVIRSRGGDILDHKIITPAVSPDDYKAMLERYTRDFEPSSPNGGISATSIASLARAGGKESERDRRLYEVLNARCGLDVYLQANIVEEYSAARRGEKKGILEREGVSYCEYRKWVKSPDVIYEIRRRESLKESAA
jgi:hypothetical protein